MANERKGKAWTMEEEAELRQLFYAGKCYYDMSKALNRTWFSVKCKLAKLELIPPFKFDREKLGLIGDNERYEVPYEMAIQPQQEEPVSYSRGENTFLTSELDIVTDYLKTRLAKVTCMLVDGPDCHVKLVELKMAKEVLENEIMVANNMKKITIKDREKVLKRLC